MTRIHPLIICGGNGTRLWPVSRTQSPKQFQKLGEETSRTFFQAAVERHRGPGYEAPVIVSSVRHRLTITAQLAEIDTAAQIILEPMGRNTGPAVLAAALMLVEQDPDAIMVVVPADHVIDGDINSTILAMVGPAKAGHIITFGIKPRYAETGFGYITDGGPVVEFPGLRVVDRFVEKPPSRKARLLVESDIAYWASGLSMFAAKTIIAEYTKFDAPTVEAVRKSVSEGYLAADGLELNATHFAATFAAPTESMVFEKTDRIALAPLDVDWSDVGSWTAMYGISKSNPQGNVLQGDVIAVETTNCMVRSTSRLVTLVGMKDVIVIDTPDALLVTRVGHCQSVKKVAEYLRVEKRIEAERHATIDQTPAARPYDVQLPLFHSEALTLTTARIAPGASLHLDAVASRDVIVAKGEVMFSASAQNATLTAGQRRTVTDGLPALLVNLSHDDVEVVLMTLRDPGQPSAPGLSQPHVLYA